MEGMQETVATAPGQRRVWDPGEAVPWFHAPTLQGNPNYEFSSVAGRYVLLFLAGSAADPAVAQSMARLGAYRDLLDDRRACFFGIATDPEDERAGRIAKHLPGFRWFLDYDRRLSQLLRAVDGDQGYTRFWILLDPTLRVVGTAGPAEVETLLTTLRRLVEAGPVETPAPVAVIPRIFEPELCRHLISLYESNGGKVSGYMRDVAGTTTGFLDNSFKRRFDYAIQDETIKLALCNRLAQRLIPMVQRIFQFQATHIERHIVACYDGDGEGGFFRPHRDNTSAGTAHRRFACTINLNSEDYDGGELIFPEFGTRTYRAPTGGAVVFSCALLHGAEPVTRGKRYAYLPFLYDEAGVRQRAAYQAKLDAGASGPPDE